MIKISVKTIFSFFVLTRLGFSQMNSNDFFPLSVGNSWTYNYSTESNDFLNGTSHYSLGTVPRQSSVSIKVYDILGKEIKTLVNEGRDPGEYEIEFDGSNLSSGVYFYSITAGNFRQVKKMILAK